LNFFAVLKLALSGGFVKERQQARKHAEFAAAVRGLTGLFLAQ
jgi:hypothetical protein